MGRPTGPNIGVTASAGNVKVVMSEVQKELDRINATPLKKLRDTSEEALDKVNGSIASTVLNLGKLKAQLANAGSTDNRLLKATEKQFAALTKLGIDPKMRRQLDNALGEVTGRGTRDERAKALREERATARKNAADQAAQEAAGIKAQRSERAKAPWKERADNRREETRQAERDAAKLKAQRSEKAKALWKERADNRRDAQREEERATAVEKAKRLEKANALRKERRENQRDAVRGVHEELATWERERTNAVRRSNNRSGGSGGGGDGGGTAGGGGDDRRGGLFSVAAAFDDLTGGRKFDLKKGAKFGIGGLIAGFVSDTLAQTTAAAVEQQRLGDQGGLSDSSYFGGGAAGSALGTVNAIGRSLPILGGIVSTFENIDELMFGVRQEAEQTARIFELQNEATEYGNAILKERVKLQKENARQAALETRRDYASTRGGREGRLQAITVRQVEEQARLDSTRDDAIQAERDRAKEKLDKNNKAIAGLRNQTGRGGRLSEKGRSDIAALETANKGIEQARDLKIGDIDREYNADTKRLANRSDRERSIELGTAQNRRAVEDALDAMKREREALAGDPFQQARNEFMRLKPSKENEKAYDDEVKRLRERQAEVRKERRKFEAEEEATALLEDPGFFGGNAIEQITARLKAAGLEDGAINRVEIKLEAEEAKRQADDLKKRLGSLGDEIKITLARSPLERIRAELEAENRQRIAAGGVGMTPQQLAAEEKARIALQTAREAAQTREDAKSAEQRRDDALDSLRRQAAARDDEKNPLLTERELAFGIGRTLKAYADELRTSRPELISSENVAAAQQFVATSTRKVVDAENPELVIQRESLDVLKQMKKLLEDDQSVVVDFSL